MRYSSFIQEFVDGTLDPSREDELFMLLSSNEELRSELKQYITMEKAFNKKLTAFAPSSAATINLFSQLGFVSDKGLISSSKVSRQKYGFFSKYKTLFSTSIITTVLTTLIFFATFGNKIFNNAKLTDSNNQIVKNYESSPAINNSIKHGDNKSIPFISSKELPSNADIKSNNNKRIFTRHEKSGYDNYAVNPDLATESNALSYQQDLMNDNIKDILKTSPENRYINLIPSALVLADNDSRMNNSNPSALDFRETLETYKKFTDLYISEKLGISLQISGSQYQMLISPTVRESWIPTFHNMGITLFYNITDDLLIGFSLRNEHYFQSFEGNNDLGDKYKYEQFPNYVTSAIEAKLNLIKFYPFRGFTQAAIGGTKTGIIGRFGFGLDVIASPDYEFFLSLEGSALRYLHQGNVFYSPKIGFNYGVRFTF